MQANLLAAITKNKAAVNQVYNIAFSERTTLKELYELIKKQVAKFNDTAKNAKTEYRDFRAGDVRHSLADISKAKNLLGYAPEFSVEAGLKKAAKWYIDNLG